MKKLLSSLFIATTTFSSAAAINISNLANPANQSRVLFNQAGVQLGSGYGAIGYFSGLNATTFSTSSGQALQNDFQILGSSVSSFTNNTISPGNPLAGIIEVTSTGAIGALSPFIGKDAYLLIGNAASLALSTEAFIYNLGFQFVEDAGQPVTIIDLGVPSPVGSVSLGSNNVTGNVFFGVNNAGTITNGYRTVTLVPEPSAILLSALGFLALLHRKR